MQADNSLIKYFEERLSILTLHLHNTNLHFKEEDLHQLRVEIKKMRALLRLLDIAVREDYSKKRYEKILRKLFKPGGKLRESQINIAQANEFKFQLADRYKEHLERKDEIHSKKLKQALDQFITSQLNVFENELSAFIEETDPNHLNISIFRFLRQEFETIETLFPDISDHKILHKVRMHLKASGYMVNLAMELYKDESLQTLYDGIKSVEALIGTWHDKIVFIKSLGKFADKELSPAEVHVLNSTADSVNNDIEKSHHEIETHLIQLINNDFKVFYLKYPK